MWPSGKNLERTDVPWPVDQKVASVKTEHPSHLQVLREHHQGGVGQIHREIGVLLHQGPHSRKVCQRDFGDLDTSTQNELPKGSAVGPVGEEMKYLGQDGPSGHQPTFERTKSSPTLLVSRIISIEKRYEWPCITECLLDVWQAVSPLRAASHDVPVLDAVLLQEGS
jgi:hypothetical protein